MTSLGNSDWLPLLQSAHLSLPHFANVYSTAIVQMLRAPTASAASHTLAGISSAVSPASSGSSYPQLMVATVSQLYAVHPHGPPPRSTTLTTPQSTHTRSISQGQVRSKSSTNLASVSASAAGGSPPPAGSSAPAAQILCSPLSTLEPLPLARLDDLGAELIALDAFNLGGSASRPIIAVAAGLPPQAGGSKYSTAAAPGSSPTTAPPTRFALNIYGLGCAAGSDLQSISADVQSLRLNFVPSVLTHTSLLGDLASSASSFASPRLRRAHSGGPVYEDIVLAGSDRTVHVYRYNAGSNAYAELAPNHPAHPLPQLVATPAPVLSLDFACMASAPGKTFVVAGCQDGLVRLSSHRCTAEAASSLPRKDGKQHPQQQRGSSSERKDHHDGKDAQDADDEEDEEEEVSGSPWQLGEEDASKPADGTASEGTDVNAAEELDPVRWRDFFLDGPVCSLRMFSPSAFMQDTFHARAALQDPLNDSQINRMQTRAYEYLAVNGAAANQRNGSPLAETESSLSRRASPRDSPSSSSLSAIAARRGDGSTTQESPRTARASDAPPSQMRLLLANAVGFGAVYTGFEPSALSFENSLYLQASGVHDWSGFSAPVDTLTDSVLCTTPLDINMDGRAELLLGTYAAQMLVFQEQRDGASYGQDQEDSTNRSGIPQPEGYQLVATKQFSHPIYSIRGVDLRGEGFDDLVITTMYSVDVLSWAVDTAAEVLQSKLDCVEEIKQLEAALEEMNRNATQQVQQPQQQQQQQ